MQGTTIVCIDIPAQWLVGIDLQFFESTPQFRGIKLIPSGAHVVHWGRDQNNIRTGHYFEAEESTVLVLRWDPVKEEMEINEEIGELEVSAIKSRIPDFYSYMLKYPDGRGSVNEDWAGLINRVTAKIISSVCPKSGLASSTSTTEEENQLLIRSLYDSALQRGNDDPETVKEDRIIQSLVDQENDEIKFTEIDLKRSWKPGAFGHDITVAALDKSWLLNDLISNRLGIDFQSLMGQFQLAFSMIVIFANFSAAQHWKKIVSLMVRCQQDLVDHPARFIQFFDILSLQLKTCPEEYMNEFLERSFVIREFRHLARVLKSEELSGSIDNIKASAYRVFNILSQRFDMNIEGPLRSKNVVDRATPEDSSEDDYETGEYAPVIVET